MYAFRTIELRLLACAAALPGIMLGASPLLAANELSDRVQIVLQGRIEPQCDIAGTTARLELGTLSLASAGGEKQLQFRFSCNVPFSYRLSSEHGQMRHDSALPGGSLAAAFSYRVILSIPTDDGATLSLDCASDLLSVEGCLGASGTEIASDKEATIRVSWGELNYPAIAGTYSDNLRIAFSVEN
jgi:hypothetical protein